MVNLLKMNVIDNILSGSVVPEPWHYDVLCQFTKDYPYVSLGWYALWITSVRLYDAGQISESDYRRIEHQMISRSSLKSYPSMLVPDCCQPRVIVDNESGNLHEINAEQTVFYAQEDLIDVFLTKESPWEGPRPVDDYSDEIFSSHEPASHDISEQSIQFDNEIISETLAQVYLTQGYVDRAIDIYYELSLKFPEKSVYFAGLIDRLNENQ